MRKLPVFKKSGLDPLTTPLAKLVAKEKSLKAGAKSGKSGAKAAGSDETEEETSEKEDSKQVAKAIKVPAGTPAEKKKWITGKLKSMKKLPAFTQFKIDPLTAPLKDLIAKEKEVKKAMKGGPKAVAKLSGGGGGGMRKASGNGLLGDPLRTSTQTHTRPSVQ